MNLEEVRHIYFLGIGGIGMSALARYFHSKKVMVSGYDKTPTTLTDELIAEGISVHFTDDISQIDRAFLDHPRETLIVRTPAVPQGHSELRYFLEGGFTVMKRSEVLGMITRNSFTIAVAGTHGKTTTSSMIAHILKHSGTDCTAFLGGVTKNYNTNLLLPSDPANKYVVVEADEYDRSFLTLHPDIAIITSMDADHLDIYGNAGYMQESYRMFASQVKEGGTLIYKKGLALQDTASHSLAYALAPGVDFYAENIGIDNHRFRFDWNGPGKKISTLSGDMPGRHNIENAVAALAAVSMLNIPENKMAAGYNTFTGVKRRFDYRMKSPGLVYIDDYAHHPEELKACILAARELYPGWHLCGIFQPHLYSRTRDFADGFASSLSLLDELILLDIYPARELPMEGVSSNIIFDKVTLENKILCSKDAVTGLLKDKTLGVVLTLGAGDIDQLVEPVQKLLETNLKRTTS
jgi:UDP-N-acetylmuramate--alanine ligase